MKCRICNKNFHKNGIANHIKYVHHISFQSYIKMFIHQYSSDFPHWRLRNENRLVRIGTIGKKKISGEYCVPEENVQCRICNEKIGIKGMPIHTINLHNMKYIDYVKKYYDKYPNDFKSWTKCKICKKLTKQKTTCSKKCNKKYRKTLTREKAPHYGMKHSEYTKKKISKTRKKQGNFKNGFIFSDVSKNKMKQSALKRAQLLDYVNPMFGKTHSPETIKKIFSHRKMNSIEKMVANKLNENDIKYYFQYFLSRDNICKSYDFKIKNKDIFIEVDGDYWHGGPGTKKHFYKVDEVMANDKIKEEMARENGFSVIRLWESDIKKNPNITIERLNECL